MMALYHDGAMAHAETDRDWSVLASAWELCALSFRYPDAALAEVVASGEWFEAADEIAAALNLALPEGWGVELAVHVGCDAEALLHVLRAEATRLFVGAPEPVVSPYEGVWRAKDDGVQALLFVNPHSMAVERFMRSCGLGRPEGTNEPLDHVSTECELLEHLALRAAGIAVPEECPIDTCLPEDLPAATYGTFLDGHACVWMSRFAEAVATESRQPFYRAAACLLNAIVAG